MDLKAAAPATGVQEGTVWTLEEGEDLNANLVRFPSGGGVGEHTNEEVDVILVGVAGVGSVVLDGEKHRLEAGGLVFLPKGVSRGIRSHSEDFAYLSVHRRRGPVKLGEKVHEKVYENESTGSEK